MRRLYSWLLRLYPRAVRQEFSEEMLAVFDQAAQEARPGGALAYAVFCMRETAGLLWNLGRPRITEELRMSRRRWMLAGGGTGLIATLVWALVWMWTPYTSSALIVTMPAQIPARYAPAGEINFESSLRGIVQAVTSRGALTNLINTHDLYPNERKRMPMEDVVERLRADLKLEPSGNSRLDVRFSYTDNLKAQKVTQAVVSMVIDEYVRYRSSAAMQTVEFLSDRRGAIGRRWEAALQELRAAAQKGLPLDRLQLEVSIARKSYEELSAQLAEAETAKSMEERKQGPLLQLVDPASLPVNFRPAWWGVMVLAFGGGLMGLAMGWLLSRLMHAARPTPSYSS